MARTPKPSPWRRLAGSKATLLVGSLVLLLIIVTFSREVYRRIELNSEIAGLEEQVTKLQQRQTELTNLLDYFKSPLFQEQEARKKLGLAKPGESIVIVPLESSSYANTNETAGSQKGESKEGTTLSNAQKWWRFFVNQ